MAVRTRRAGRRARFAGTRLRSRDGDPTAVHLTVTDPAPVTARDLGRLCAELAARGVRTIVTNAMDPGDAEPFVAQGFVVSEELDLLGRSLDRLPRPSWRTVAVRRRAPVLDLEAASFGATALDAAALDDALVATTAVRFRCVPPAEAPRGYAITGAAGWRGYVQRLAVHPDAQRRVIATALLADGLRWARRHGARTAVVNTAATNHAARALYEAFGFSAFPVGLWVLERRL